MVDNDIRKVEWTPRYFDPASHVGRPDAVVLKYSWRRTVSVDPEAGVVALYVSGLLGMAVIAGTLIREYLAAPLPSAVAAAAAAAAAAATAHTHAS